MNDDPGRPAPLSGLWAFLIGGIGLAALTVTLDPITRREDCPNFGGNGNASAFADPAWDLYLPALALSWVVLVIVEQLLPLTWRHRSRSSIFARAATTISLSLTGSCCLLPSLMIICH